MKKESVVTTVIIVLVLFTAIIFFRGCEISPSTDPKIFDEPGTYSDQDFYKNGEILSSEITIEDAVFSETLTISDRISNGNIYLNRCDVSQELIINGSASVYLNSGSYRQVTVNNENVQLILLGDAQIDSLTSKQAMSLVVNENSHIKDLVIEKGAKKSSITSQNKGIIGKMLIKSPTDLILNSPSDFIVFGAESTGSTFINNATVKKLQIESKMKLTIAANIETLVVTASGEGTSINLENNAIINNLGMEKPVTINGKGTVNNATMPDVSYLKGTIVPKNLSISAKPLVSDPNGGLMVTTVIARPLDPNTIDTVISQSRSNDWNSAINTRYEANDQPQKPTTNPVIPIPVPTPVPPPLPVPPPAPILVKSIHLSTSDITLLRGDSKVITAVVLPENADNKEVIWKTSDSKVAIVSKGIVTPKGNGLATITATTVDGNHSANCKVTVKTNITAVSKINNIEAENNSIKETLDYGSEYALPTSLVINGYSDERLDCPVNWTPAFADTKKPGETIYTGSLNLPSGYLNPQNIQAKIILTIGSKPVITFSPVVLSQRIFLETNPAPIQANASVTEDKSLNYEWFYKLDQTENMIPIASARSANYSPPVSRTPGIIYYYCKVSANQADSITQLCGIVETKKEVAEFPELAQLPVISKEPASQNISKTQATFELSTEAQVSKGKLTYQWYKSDNELPVGGSAIENAINKNLNVLTSELLSPTYYYVEITNHQEGYSPAVSVSQSAKIIIE